MTSDSTNLKTKRYWQRGVAFICGVLFLFLAACSGAGNVVDPQISADELSLALLALDDLPANWLETPLDDDEPEETIQFLCAEIERGYMVNGRSEFEFSDSGPFLTQQIYVYADENAAQEAFASYQEAVENCATWNRELSGGTTIDWEVDSLNLSDIGAESFAIRSTSFNAPLYIKAQIDQAVMLEGNAIVTVLHLGLGRGDLSVEDTKQFAELSLGKFAELK